MESKQHGIDADALRAMRELDAAGWYVTIHTRPRVAHRAVIQRLGDDTPDRVEQYIQDGDTWQQAVIALWQEVRG